MNPLTPEQINRGKNFTELEKRRFDAYVLSGRDPVTAFNMVIGSPIIEEKKQPTILGKMSRNILKTPARMAQNIQAVGRVIGGQTFEEASAPRESKYFGEGISPIGVSDGGGLNIQNLRESIGAGLELASYLPIGRAIGSTARGIRGLGSIGQSAKTVGVEGAIGGGLFETGKQATEGEFDPLNIAQNMIVSGVGGFVLGGAGATTGIIGRGLGRSTKSLIDRIGVNSKKIPTTEPVNQVFIEAKSRGFSPVDSKVFSEFNNVDKKVGAEMLDLSEKISTGDISIATSKFPIDIVGQNITDDITALENLRKKFGKNVDNVAKSLKGKTIDTKPLQKSVKSLLNEYEISINKEGVNFNDSEFALLESVQKDIQKAIEFIQSPKKDAYDIHRIKKTLDGLINPLKQGEGLQGSAKKLIGDLRRTVDNFLDTRFTAYNKANTQFSEIRNILEKSETALGKDMVTSKTAQKLRSVFSNSGNRDVVKEFLRELDLVREKYNLKDNGNLYNQIYLAEKLEDMFGTQAITGIRGQIEGAVRGARNIIEGLRDPIKGLGNVAGDIVETVARQRPQDRIEFLRKIFNNQ